MKQIKLNDRYSPQDLDQIFKDAQNTKSELDLKQIGTLERLIGKVNETFGCMISDILQIKKALVNKLISWSSHACAEENIFLLKQELEILQRKIVLSSFNPELLNRFSDLIQIHKKNGENSQTKLKVDLENLKEKIIQHLDTLKANNAETTRKSLDKVEKWTYEATKENIKKSLPSKQDQKPIYSVTELRYLETKLKMLTGLYISKSWAILHFSSGNRKSLSIMSHKWKKYAQLVSSEIVGAKDAIKILDWKKGNMLIFGEKLVEGSMALSFLRINKSRITKVAKFIVDDIGDKTNNLFDIIDDRGLLVIAAGKTLKIFKVGRKEVRTIQFEENIELVKYLKDIRCLAVLSGSCLYIKQIDDNLANGRILHKIPTEMELGELIKSFINKNIIVLVSHTRVFGIDIRTDFYRIFEKKLSKKEKVAEIIIFPEHKMLFVGIEDSNPFVYDFWQEKTIEYRFWKENLTHPKIELANSDGSKLLIRTQKVIYECSLKKNK